MWILTRSDTNQAVWLEAWNIVFMKKLYCTIQVAKTKAADQLRGYHEADLRLCRRICKTLVFSMTRLIYYHSKIWAATWENRILAYAKTKTQISFAVAAKLISGFVFATWIVHFLFFLNPKFQASSHLQWLPGPVCVREIISSLLAVLTQKKSYSMT